MTNITGPNNNKKNNPNGREMYIVLMLTAKMPIVKAMIDNPYTNGSKLIETGCEKDVSDKSFANCISRLLVDSAWFLRCNNKWTSFACDVFVLASWIRGASSLGASSIKERGFSSIVVVL